MQQETIKAKDIENEDESTQELNLSNNFMFVSTLSNRDVCKEFLSELMGFPVELLSDPVPEKVEITKKDKKGTRLDVYVRDKEGTVYDVEMQATFDRSNFAKRLRYYSSNTDVSITQSGVHYSALPICYLVFICTFDPFDEGRHMYTFEDICLEDEKIHLNDGQKKIILSTKGTMDDVSDNLKEFLEYVENSTDEQAEKSKGALTKLTHKQLLHVKEKLEKEMGEMTVQDWMDDLAYEARIRVAKRMIERGEKDMNKISHDTELPLATLMEL